jgi:hypothetical protein
MKNFQSFTLFLLFCLSAAAQSHKTNLIETLAAINSILCQDRNAHFTNRDYELFYPIKINANLQGDVFCIESSTRFGKESNGLMFNLLRVKSFIIKAAEIVGLDQKQDSLVAIHVGNEQETLAFKKELEALLVICVTYSKKDPKFKCE